MTVHSRGATPRPGELAWLTRAGETDHDTGIDSARLLLRPGEAFELPALGERAVLLLDGEVTFAWAGGDHTAQRRSLFDALPTCVQVDGATTLTLRARSAAEVMLFATANDARFSVRVYRPEDVRDEHRGRGVVRNACYRFVRTIFDRANAPEGGRLVLGEVVTLPGRWSSYPPHHHPQPEIYHYRFQPSAGYGHAELGDTVLKVRDGDTVKIFDGHDHPQCAAPGYAMWYSWVIRHLPGQPYDQPTFDPTHTWVNDPKAAMWWPQGVD